MTHHFHFATATPSVSQLSIPAKKKRFGPKVATQAWWIDRIEKDPFFRQPRDHFISADYSFERNQDCLLSAKLDFVELAGTRRYPPKAPDFKPQRYRPVGGLEYRDFKIWAWLEANQALGNPIDQEAQEWYNFTTTYYFKREAVELLGVFFRPESQKPFNIILEEEHNSVPTNTALIQDIVLDIPTGANYCSHLSSLNNTIKDTRYLPITREGERIHSKFIKYYLEERLAEYLALGGLTEIIQREALNTGDYKLPDAFYWDLWGNMRHLRESYQEYQEQEHFDPYKEEDPLYI